MNWKDFLAGVAFVFMLGATWNAGFEADPAATDAISQGYLRIQETKNETRNRSETEHCFGSFDATGCVASDDGRHRLGSALPFYSDAETFASGLPTTPTTLNVPDNAADSDLDDGRLLCAIEAGLPDSPNEGEHDGCRLYVQDDDAQTDAGTGDNRWEDVVALSIVDSDQATSTRTDTIATGADEAWATTGGVPANGVECNVPEEGNYEIVVTLNLKYMTDSSNGIIRTDLLESINGVAAAEVESWEEHLESSNKRTNLYLVWRNTSPTAGEDHVYTMEARSGATDAEFNYGAAGYGSAGAPALTPTSTLRCEVIAVRP